MYISENERMYDLNAFFKMIAVAQSFYHFLLSQHGSVSKCKTQVRISLVSKKQTE
jgi:hypothetical protein